MINTYAFATKSYLPLLEEILIPSFNLHHPSENFNLHIVEREITPNLAGATHDNVYKDLMLYRMQFYLNALKEHKNEKVLFLDGDIIIFRPFLDNIEKELEKNDLCHQGGGILAFNSNNDTISFFQSFVDKCKSIPSAARQPGYPECELLDSFKEFSQILKICKLSHKYGFLNKNSFLYHAMNGGNTILEKKGILFSSYEVYQQLKHKSNQGLLKNSSRYATFKTNKENQLICEALTSFNSSTGKVFPFKIPVGFKKILDEDFFSLHYPDDDFYVQFVASWIGTTYCFLRNIKCGTIECLSPPNTPQASNLFF